jgi:hypothetical protein
VKSLGKLIRLSVFASAAALVSSAACASSEDEVIDFGGSDATLGG